MKSALTHVHGVSGPTRTNDHNLCSIGSSVGGAGIGRGRDGEVEVFATIREGIRNASRDRTVGLIIWGVEVFNLVGGGEGSGEVNIDVGVGPSDHDRAIGEKDSGGVVQAGDGRTRQTVRAPSRALGSGRIVDAGTTNGSRGQGHTEGHLSVGRGGEGSLCVSGGTIEPTVHDEESGIRKDDELTHGTTLEKVIILLPNRAGSVERLGSDALAVLGSGNQPGIDEGPGVVAPVVLRHVATTAEEESRIVLVLRG